MTDSSYDQFLIHPGALWDVYVSEIGRNNLGRLYFWLKRDGIVDYSALTSEERAELLTLHTAFGAALKALWSPELLNFAYLANGLAHGHHCHWHLVPRYSGKMVLAFIEFVDVGWGGHP
jgi:diadenosine tetraphosphate (Ap4A) HIT family hydrolase